MRLKKEKINRDSNLINPFEYVRRKKEIEKEVRSLNDIMILLKNENGKIIETDIAKKYKEKFVEIAIDEYQKENQ